uniref:Transcriptional adapter n=1 Tax=Photinus pyralis TaxID=7054 RepID=A0A1Y1LJI4_PHOPY
MLIVHGSNFDVKNEECTRLAPVNTSCLCCNTELSAPYIVCVVCEVNICCMCFANGREFLNHKNNHEYSIFDDNFVLFEKSNWTAREELILLDTLLDYGNFSLVHRQLPNRSFKEIKEHYDEFYLNKKASNLLPSFIPVPLSSKHEIMPYRFHLNDIDDPPRHNPNSVGYHTMAGYNAARSDFELEYDSNAEDLIASLNFKNIDRSDPDYELMTDLQCAIISSYNRRLLERQRRKAIIRNHGLILIRKTIGWLHRYDATITRRVYGKMCRFMQFFSGMHFEYLMEGLHHAAVLKNEIFRLCEFHKKGITSIPSAHLYLHLRQRYEESFSDLKMFKNNIQLNWKVKHSVAASTLPINLKRRGVFSPLDVLGLPGYEKLTSKEKELCRNVRLVPMSYIEFRDILVNESRKGGHLKLQAARRLLKIDVNKTRRLYDFLVTEGYINK